MKRIAAMILVALLGAACVALAQGPPPGPPAGEPPGPPPGPPPQPGLLGDPELARLTTDIVVLRAINRINATPGQLERLAELVRGLADAETELRGEAAKILADERERLLAAKPGEQPPPGEDLEAMKSLVKEFHDKVQAAQAEADKFLDPEQIRAFRLLLAMTRGEPRDRLRRARSDGGLGPDMDGPPPPAPPPPGGDQPVRERMRDRMRDRMERAGQLPRPPVPLQRVAELVEEKLAALRD